MNDSIDAPRFAIFRHGVPAPRTLVAVAAGALAVAGVLFALYPAIRPFSDETSLEGAAAFASSSWIVAHTLGMAAFALLMLGFLGLFLRLQTTRANARPLVALGLACAGILLTLPFYGAETFALHSIGQEALDRGDQTIMSLADSVRSGPGIAFLGLGLVLLAAGAVLFAIENWKAGGASRWSLLILALALVLYLPQFLAPEAVRITHGLLMAVGCLFVAYELNKSLPGGIGISSEAPGARATIVDPRAAT